MSPPEGEEPTTATAEPEVPETPQLGEQPSLTEEAVPAAEQEQPEGEEPKGVSETQPPEDEAQTVEQTADAVLEQLKEADPELAEALREKLGVTDTDRLGEQEREFSQREVERDKTERQSTLTKAVEGVTAYTPQGIQQAAATWGNELARRVTADAQELMKAGEGDANLLDSGAIAQQVSGFVGNAVLAWSNYQSEQFGAAIFDALEGDDAHSHLSTDEKRALRESRSKPLAERIGEALPLYLAAARRSAPEVKGKAEAKKTEADLKLAQTLENITKVIPRRNGSRGTEPAPRDKRTEDQILLDPETPIEEIKRITARRTGAA